MDKYNRTRSATYLKKKLQEIRLAGIRQIEKKTLYLVFVVTLRPMVNPYPANVENGVSS